MALAPTNYSAAFSNINPLDVASRLQGLQTGRLQQDAIRQQTQQQQLQADQLQGLRAITGETDWTNPEQVAALQQQFPGLLEEIGSQQEFARGQQDIARQEQEHLSLDQKKNINTAADKLLIAEDTGNEEVVFEELENQRELIDSTGNTAVTVDVLKDVYRNDPAKFRQMMNRVKSITQEKTIAKQMGTGDMSGYVFDPETGSMTIDPNIQKQLVEEAAKVAAAGKKLDFNQRTTLQDKVGNIVSGPVEIRQAANDLNRLRSLSPDNRSAQVAAVYKFIKSLDPQGVVREGEQIMLAKGGGPAEQFSAYISRLTGDGILTTGMIDELVETAKGLSNESSTGARETLTNFLDGYGDTVDQETKDSMYRRMPQMFPEKQPDEESNQEQQAGTRQPPPAGTQIVTNNATGERYYLIDGIPVPVSEFQTVPTPPQRTAFQQNHTIADA